MSREIIADIFFATFLLVPCTSIFFGNETYLLNTKFCGFIMLGLVRVLKTISAVYSLENNVANLELTKMLHRK